MKDYTYYNITKKYKIEYLDFLRFHADLSSSMRHRMV